ncbi:hypothetical protein [Vulgatibacter sp.]|uniref:hypothetical protein n=1 Tax=Vulgatibacter sp. TaxID=1971226 RepID=UPI0035658507
MKALLLAGFLLGTAQLAPPASVGAGPAGSAPAQAAAPQPPPPDEPPVQAVPVATPEHYVARVEPEAVQLGQPFVYEVRITDAAEVRYDLPRRLQLGTLAVRGVDLRRTVEGPSAVTTARIELAIFDTLGPTQLPDLGFTVLRPDGIAHFVVPGIPLTVQGGAEGEELDDIRPPQELRLFSALPLGIAAGVLFALVAILFAVRWFRRWRAARPVAALPVGSPEERALAALDALAATPLGDGRAFYFGLSTIVRGFLEEVTSLSAREMTTAELVDALVAREVPGLSLASLGAWLERGDLHRFARAPAEPAAASADLEKAREIVRGVAGALRPKVEEAA